MAQRPNIVYLMVDQQKASATGVYGNSLVSCPFTERIASRGVVFNDAYTVSTICTPSRASVMTGVHPLVHQVTCWHNKAPLNMRQLPEFLAADGYYTAAAGHFEFGRNFSRGWHEQVDLFERGALGKALEFKYAHGLPDRGWSSGALECTPEEGYSARLARRAVRMLDSAVRSRAPFFLHVAFNDPHPPYFVPPPYDSRVDPARITLPPRGSPRGRPRWQFEALEQIGTDRATPGELKKTIATYYGLMMYVDAQLQQVYDAMAARGLLDNTWIIFGVDHGDFMGEKGLFEKCEVPYECLQHVPLIIVPPESLSAARGARVSGFVENIDLFPTILGLAGVPVPSYAQGHDLVAWLRDGARAPLRDCVFAQVGDYQGFLKNTFPGGTFGAGRRKSLVQGGRTRECSYIRDTQYGDEAYDLESDPGELENLLNAGNAPEPPRVAALRRRVDQWEETCLRLRAELGVVPGERGFEIE
jgi:arylsulfatase A-like enzyme